MKLIFLFAIAVLASDCFSQAPGVSFPFEQFEHDGIPTSILKQRREKILANHTKKSLIILFSADVRNRQNDVDYEFRQNSNLLYLTNSTEPKTALMLVPGGVTVDGVETSELFFIRKRDISREVWSGVKMGVKESEQYLGITKAVEYSRLQQLLDSLLQGRDTLFIASGFPSANVLNPVSGKNVYVDQNAKDFLHEKYPDLIIRTTLPDLASMREIKDAEELRLLRRAIDISVDAHIATMRGAKSGMKEYELEAIMEYHFKKAGAEDVGYPSIVGSGYNSCILHYETNRKATQMNDMILADCGAEYHGYTADITRTFPIKGTFSNEQKLIYNIVLEAQDSGIAACRSGNAFRTSHRASMSVVQKRLRELGIIKDSKVVRYYFMHGTSHYLGLDVHDLGTSGSLKPGVVMTVEPGVYIPSGSPCDAKWWNINVRIEDDILVTDGEPVNLSGRLPRSAEAIEELMKKGE